MSGDDYVEIDVEVKTVLPASAWVRFHGEERNIVREWKLRKLGWT